MVIHKNHQTSFRRQQPSRQPTSYNSRAIVYALFLATKSTNQICEHHPGMLATKKMCLEFPRLGGWVAVRVRPAPVNANKDSRRKSLKVAEPPREKERQTLCSPLATHPATSHHNLPFSVSIPSPSIHPPSTLNPQHSHL